MKYKNKKDEKLKKIYLKTNFIICIISVNDRIDFELR